MLVFFLRHFPTEYDVQLAGQIEEQAETLPVRVLGQTYLLTSFISLISLCTLNRPISMPSSRIMSMILRLPDLT